MITKEWSGDIVFIRKSDVRQDTRMRKAVEEAIDSGKKPLVLGWIRDGAQSPPSVQSINGKTFSSHYFTLESAFGRGLGIRNLFKMMAFNFWILRLLIVHRRRYQAIYACDFDVSIPAVVCKFILRKTLVYDIFDFYSHTHRMPYMLQKVVEKAEYAVAGFSDHTIVCTEKRAAMLFEQAGVIADVIYNTPKMPDFIGFRDPSPRRQTDSFTIVYVGTLPHSGRLLMEVTERLKGSSEIELLIAGLGPLDGYLTQVADKYSNVQFFGHLSYEAALNLQTRADLLFATYDPAIEINRNSAPNKVYEAMALGKPIVVCRNTDADRLVMEKEFGCAIDYSADQFMEVARNYLCNEELRALHASNAMSAYRGGYDWEICARRLRKIFESVT